MMGSSCLAGPALWIDESLMNLCEILGFQPKGVATLSFSSRKRPAYAGMTVAKVFIMGWSWVDLLVICVYSFIMAGS